MCVCVSLSLSHTHTPAPPKHNYQSALHHKPEYDTLTETSNLLNGILFPCHHCSVVQQELEEHLSRIEHWTSHLLWIPKMSVSFHLYTHGFGSSTHIMTAWVKFYISRVFIQLTKKMASIWILRGCFVMVHFKQHSCQVLWCKWNSLKEDHYTITKDATA